MTFVDIGPKPTDPVEAALWFFAGTSNWGNLHPEDDYVLHRGCCYRGSQWNASDVENRLMK